MLPLIDRWSSAPDGIGPYEDPSLAKGLLVCGIVTGHGKIRDGAEISTSRVQSLSMSKSLAVTQNTTYALGDMCPKFERWRKRRGYTDPIEYTHGQ